MPDKNFIMDLAKLLIAAAWADGELSNEEINSLKDLLFTLPEISGREWTNLEIYMDSPVTSEARETLFRRVASHIKSDRDKDFVVQTLDKLFRADGVVSEEEKALLERVRQMVSSADTSFFGRLGKMMKGVMKTRNEAYASATQRESKIDDYIENTVYYQLRSECESKGIKFDLPEQRLRKLCLAGGLLARIAAVDCGISEQEKQTINDVLSSEWGLSGPEATLVAEISCHRTLKGLDYYRLARGFFDCTGLDERRSFLKCLFKIANASDKTSSKETEEIRKISNSLKLSHKDFIEAKLTIPDEEREVL